MHNLGPFVAAACVAIGRGRIWQLLSRSHRREFPGLERRGSRVVQIFKDPMEVLQFATDRYASKLMQKVIEFCAPVGLRSVLRQESIRVLDGSEHGLGFLKALLTSTAFRQETITSLQRAGLAERWLVSAVDSSFEILTAFKQQIRTDRKSVV